MTLLEWLIILLVYLAAYGLWSVFETYRERAPYRSRKSRRVTKFVVLTLVLVGLGAAYNSAAVKSFFQPKPTSESAPNSIEEPAKDESGAKGLGVQLPKSSEVGMEVERDLSIATLSSREVEVREVGFSSPPPITSVPPQTAPTPVASNQPKPVATTPPAPKPFKVTFQSDPPGAALYINSERVGVTPIELSLTEDEPVLYTLRAEAGVPNYPLYHPYSNTLELTRDTSLSVWLERLNGEEVAALQRRNANREVAPVHLEHVSANTTRYKIATDCSEGLDLTYTDKAQRVVQERGRKDGWAYGFIPKPGQFLYLYARNNCASGSLTVQLVQDGEVLEENTAMGRDAIATISTYW